jgi:serine/threonine protein kinase
MLGRLKVGFLLTNRYQILRVAGDGSFGVVYAAYDLRTYRLVAIKELPMQSIVDCERQAHLRAALVHPAIPKIHDYFSTETNSYLIMDFIQGTDLEAILDKTTEFLEQKRVLNWAIQICAALDYLHTHPLHTVIFRDLKPNNVMADDKDQVYLVDFGLARIFPAHFFDAPHPEFKHLEKGLAFGTEGYSPPEQYSGIVLPQSDLYALGASLHHLLTRRDPHQEPAFSFDEAPIRALNPAVSPDLEAIIMKSVQRDPEDRYPTARAMLLCLQALSLEQ